jgi:uncharacterized membrane protein (DUF485 family)
MMKPSAIGAIRGAASKTPSQIIESQDFKALVARRWTVSALLLGALFITYYGYILLIAADKTLMSRRIGEVTTLAIPVGIGVIVIAFLLTAIYVAWANRKYDPEVERLKKQLRP